MNILLSILSVYSLLIVMVFISLALNELRIARQETKSINKILKLKNDTKDEMWRNNINYYSVLYSVLADISFPINTYIEDINAKDEIDKVLFRYSYILKQHFKKNK